MNPDKQKSIGVLLVGPILPTGGITRFLKFCLENQMDAKLQLYDVARPPKENIAFAASGYSEIFNAGLGRAIKGFFITLKNIILFPITLLRSRVNIVHLAGTGWLPFWEYSMYGVIAKLLGKKVIFHYHGPFEDFHRRSSKIIKPMIHWVFNQFDAIIVLSKSDEIVVSLFVPNRKVYIIPNGVKIHQHITDKNKKVKDLKRILFLGGIDPIRKGLLDLVNAVNLAVKQGMEIEWLMGGTKTTLNIIEQNSSQEAKKFIKYVGILTEKEKIKLYQTCDVYILPSYDEGMPYAILEAMSFGLVIISSRIGGIPEVISEGINGYLIEPGDSLGIVKYIRKLWKNPELILRISKNNRQAIIEHFSESVILKEIDDLYKVILQQNAIGL